ncbi:MAG: alanine--tRNA ligase-related protein, partial [Candidatus Woesearchaeota archaeon]
NKAITFHEDAWDGGGNFRPCMEYFSRGLELGNQVYMLYEQTPSGRRELPLKVLDMGMGHERNAWFTKGTSTSYETTFPTVSKKLYELTGIKPEGKLLKKFLPYASYLNIDEVDDINKAWKNVAEKIDVDVNELKEKIVPLSALYSVAEHTRSALFAINDGALPNNVGGGYNLRVIIRRALDFLEKYEWNTELNDIADWHADYLKPIFPELSENLESVKTILDVEKRKYNETKTKSKQIIINLLNKQKDKESKETESKETDINEKKLFELYTSQGISPEMIKKQALLMNKKIKVPDDFYKKISELYKEEETKKEIKEKLDLEGLPDTEILYYNDFALTEFEAVVLKVIDNKLILDRTAFYPTSGGQLHDIGSINVLKSELKINENKEYNLVDCYKQGSIVVHVFDKELNLKKGDLIKGKIDFKRRLQLAQHHTSTHIINGCAKRVLGKHIWQAGANKDIDKARLDITHYEALTDEQMMKIEKMANEIIEKNLPVYSTLMKRNLAELEYGFVLYQGGAVPGKVLRIVNIPGFDVEACGGTHLHTTGEAKIIKILKTTKIQDAIVRIEFTAGEAAMNEIEKELSILQKAAKELDCKINQIPSRANELFEKWKKVVKKGKIEDENDFKILSMEESKESETQILKKTSELLKTQPEHIINTIVRFKKELESKKQN